MLSFISSLKEQIEQILTLQLTKAIEAKELPEAEFDGFLVEYTPNKPFGDFASNVALFCAKRFKLPPQELAELILKDIDLSQTEFSAVNFKNGFLNFRLSAAFYSKALEQILEAKADYGTVNVGNGQKIVVEFVSANPTGPMHLGNARGGALGDCLSNIMQKAGFKVTKEFYINDAGNQIEVFKKSLDARFVQEVKGQDAVSFPEDGYHGEDVIALVREFIKENGTKLIDLPTAEREQVLVDYALPKNIAAIKETLDLYRVNYDVWFSETYLHKNGCVQEVIEKLTKKGLTYKKDGAVWYRFSGAKDGDKDEVLVRANGNYTYFAADIAYGYNKFVTRGFDEAINILGADHHGHIERLQHAFFDLGIDPNKFKVVIMQVVRLIRDGEVVKMSKRTGKSVTLAELLDEVPIDAARFFFGFREAGSHLDFDLNLAVEQSAKNPIYYIQYAHARICSLIKNTQNKPQIESKLECESEQDLIKSLMAFPEIIKSAAFNLDPSLINKYLLELATKFHKFYNECRVLTESGEVFKARFKLCKAVKQTLQNGLELLKISAPEVM